MPCCQVTGGSILEYIYFLNPYLNMIFYIISDESTAFSESPAIKITGDSLANFPHVGPTFTPDTLEQAGPVHLTSGNTIRFRCEIQGAPPSKLTWVKVIHQKEFLISCIDPNHKFNPFPVTLPFMPVPFYVFSFL